VANGATWLPLARRLGPRFSVAMPDLAGHGRRRGERFRFDAALDEIAATIARAQKPPILVGDSLGGYLALAVAARAGDAIAGLVVGGCTYPLNGVAGRLSALTDLCADGLMNLLGAARLDRLLARSFVRLTASLDLGSDAIAIGARGFAVSTRGETLRALLGRDFLALAQAIRVPTVFVNGALDYPIRFGESAFCRAVPGARLAIAPGVGHGVGLLYPQTFADAIERL